MLAHLLALLVAALPADTIVARVGAERIDLQELLDRAHQAHIPGETALDGLVQEALLASAARKDGLAATPALRVRFAAERRHFTTQRLLDLEVTSRVAVTDAEVQDAFHARADRVRLSMVMRATREEAQRTLERIRGGAALIEEAKTSIDPLGRSRSGVLGWFSRNELAPGLAKEAFAAPLDQIAGPVALEKGFAVFVVHERTVGTQEALRRAAPDIQRSLLAARRDDRAARLLRELRRRSPSPMSDPELVAREAERRGLERDPDVVRAMRRSERAALAQAYVDRIARSIEPPSEAELEATYHARADEFWVPERRSCDLLLARTEQQAEELRTRLVAGEALDAVAKDSAESITGERAGKHILFSDPELDTMTSSKDDQHMLAWTIRKTPPEIWAKVETNGHWHVLRCGTPEPRHQIPFSEARADLMRSLKEQKVKAEVGARIQQLRKTIPIQIAPPPKVAAGERR